MRGRVVHLKREQFDVRIDRQTEWGNPFRLRREDERGATIQTYREWLWNEINRGRWTLSELSELSGKTLGCWCAPNPCHGDVLGAAADWALTELCKNDGLWRVEYKGNVCAGFVVERGVVTECAPILRKKLEWWRTIAKRVEREEQR